MLCSGRFHCEGSRCTAVVVGTGANSGIDHRFDRAQRFFPAVEPCDDENHEENERGDHSIRCPFIIVHGPMQACHACLPDGHIYHPSMTQSQSSQSPPAMSSASRAPTSLGTLPRARSAVVLVGLMKSARRLSGAAWPMR